MTFCNTVIHIISVTDCINIVKCTVSACLESNATSLKYTTRNKESIKKYKYNSKSPYYFPYYLCRHDTNS